MPKYQFVRDTTPREDSRLFKAGEVVELSGASLRHWIRREAVVAFFDTEIESTEPTDSAVEENPNAENDDHPGDGPQPDAAAGGEGSPSAPAKKSKGPRRK